MTRYYKATARDVTVTRSSDSREYAFAVISWLKPHAPDQWHPAGLPARAADPSFHSARVHAEKQRADRLRSSAVDWAEIAPAEEITSADYRALRARR